MRPHHVASPCRPVLVLIALSVVILSGCRTPDLRPFRDSTVKIHRSVVEAQEYYTAELERLEEYAPEASKPDLQKEFKRFSTNWTARIEVMDAILKYSASLAAVAGAPDQAKAGLQGLKQSVQELGVAAGPYAPAIQGGTELFTELKFLADNLAAARQLKKAVLATDPSMQKLAQLLASDFARMRRTLELSHRSINNWIDGRRSVEIDARQTVENNVITRTKEMKPRLNDPQWAVAVADFNREMVEAKHYLAEADKWYLPHQAEVKRAREQLAARISLLRDTERALAQWGAAHGALAKALQNNMAPDWTLLMQSAERIQGSIQKITKENDKP